MWVDVQNTDAGIMQGSSVQGHHILKSCLKCLLLEAACAAPAFPEEAQA